MTAIIVIWLICGVLGALLAERKGHSPAVWGIVCLLTGVIGIFVLALVPRADRRL